MPQNANNKAELTIAAQLTSYRPAHGMLARNTRYSACAVTGQQGQRTREADWADEARLDIRLFYAPDSGTRGSRSRPYRLVGHVL